MTVVAPISVLRSEQPTRRGLPHQARNYLVALGAVAITATVAVSLRPGELDWRDLGVLLMAAAAAQYFAEHGPANQVFHGGMAFTVAAVLLLPPEQAVLVCIVQHLPEWARQRYPWYIQTFNIANYALSALVASGVWNALHGHAAGTGSRDVLAAAGSGAVFVVVNHAQLALMLKLARGRDLAATRLFGVDGLTGGGVLAATGIAFAFTLDRDPLLAVVVAIPLLLVRRALAVPLLREEASKDPKTGLLNARGLERAAEQELQRALRFGRPVSLILCDVDGLRAINNAHGHLAGDAALAAVADTLCTELRDYDLCGRFGGDEFVVVLPETGPEEAAEVAQRLDAAISTRTISAGRAEFVVTLSTGVATMQSAGDFGLDTLLAAADAAMYDVKRGRAGVGSQLA
jgi:diguanylate cyclase (GGDEF)-like protein